MGGHSGNSSWRSSSQLHVLGLLCLVPATWNLLHQVCRSRGMNGEMALHKGRKQYHWGSDSWSVVQNLLVSCLRDWSGYFRHWFYIWFYCTRVRLDLRTKLVRFILSQTSRNSINVCHNNRFCEALVDCSNSLVVFRKCDQRNKQNKLAILCFNFGIVQSRSDITMP